MSWFMDHLNYSKAGSKATFFKVLNTFQLITKIKAKEEKAVGESVITWIEIFWWGNISIMDKIPTTGTCRVIWISFIVCSQFQHFCSAFPFLISISSKPRNYFLLERFLKPQFSALSTLFSSSNLYIIVSDRAG